MAQRSDQAVASLDREQPPAAPEDPPPVRRLIAGWVTALAALGVSTALLGAGLWFARFALAEFMLGAALSERGIDADFEVINLDWDGAALANLRIGAEAAPDAEVPLVEARWRWRGFSPHVQFVRLVRPRLHLALDDAGRISAGSLDRFGAGEPGRSRPSIPSVELEILEGRVAVAAPFGALTAEVDASGVIGRDFSMLGVVQRTSRPGEAFSAQALEATLRGVSRDDTLVLQLDASAERLVWAGARTEDASLRAHGRIPLDLSAYSVEAVWRAEQLDAGKASARDVNGALTWEASTGDISVTVAHWNVSTRATASVIAHGDNALTRAQLTASANGDGARGQARWTLAGARLDGLSVTSAQPRATGALRFDIGGPGAITGDMQISLEHSRLPESGLERLQHAFPDLPGAPVGPALASADLALSRAARAFNVTVPLTLSGATGNVVVRLETAAEARSASGAVLRVAPLRADAPALEMVWPGAALHGAVEATLAGGGAPSASLLIDVLDWSPDAPFEADGTLSLENWRAGNSRIDAGELAIGITAGQNQSGRVDLRGPMHISGPLGDGEIRDMTATLNIAAHWGQGWRITSNNACLPISLGGADAAGLSFSNGRFSLCQVGGALIAADANGALSGGFRIQALALNGRMSGPEAQPAHLTAQTVTGQFRGRSGDIGLDIAAEQPRLAIAIAEARTLSLTMARMTANARIASSWRVEGAFERGALTDPALPGVISTIEGGWSAAPEDGAPVIRVDAGEALLTANRPASESERPLFNPLRLLDVSAVMRGGEIDAQGQVVLEDRARQLARFDAHHDITAGEGAARIAADRIVFGPELQPYEITERARGLVENVRGPIAVGADIDWTRHAIRGRGVVRIDGVSLATSTIPIVNDVHGSVAFDDLFALTTAPGQAVTVGELNPGLAVQNGRVRFQLLTDQRVAIESAEFDFAAGVLAMSPTTITLGADETRFKLTLRDVDAAHLLQTLNVPDLAATGRVEGSFPLLLTRRSAFIEGGVLRAQDDGGFLSYTGAAGADATGMAAIAFDALRSFRYDALTLTLDGDLNGEVVSSIEFSGENSGRPVDLGPITPVPGLGRVTARGVPFDFNVRITAPFRRLAQTAAGITDPGALIDRARQEQEAVDPEPQAPR